MATFLRNVLYLSAADVLSKVLNFFAQIFLARRLGAGGFGKVNLALALVAYFTLITDFNLTTVGTRDVAKSKDALSYASSFVTLRMVLSVIAFGLLLIFVSVLNKPAEMKILIVLFGLSLFPSVLLLEWFYNGIEKMDYLGASRVVRAAVFLGLLLLAIGYGYLNVQVAALAYVASWLSSLLPQVYWAKKNAWRLRFQCNLDHWRQIVRDAAPLALSVVMTQVFYSLDTVMLGFMKNDEAVGWYSAGYRIVTTVLGSAAVFGNTLYPVMARQSGSPDGLRRLLYTSSKLLLFFSLPIAVGGTVLGAPLLTALYGAEYMNGAPAFQVLIWRVVAVYANLPFAYCLLACNKGREYLYSVAIAVSLSPLFNVVLISKYSGVGAAIATLTTECVLLAMFFVFSQKTVAIPAQGLLTRPLIASAIMGLVVSLVHAHVFLRIVLGAAVYLSIVLSLKWVTKEDLRMIG